jgi:hydrogenase 3 maturation protease
VERAQSVFARNVRGGRAIERVEDIAHGRVVVVGVGNALKADDAAGQLLAEALRRRFPDRVFDAGQVPENYLGPIRRARPDTILLVDAADFGGAPGDIRLATEADVGGLALGTHAAPLSMFMALAAAETGAAVHLVAVQAKSTELGGTMCEEVRAAVGRLGEVLATVLERGRET